jgi:uncharacterized spore protein YtfJ
MAIQTQRGGIEEIIGGVKDSLGVKRVFGDPVERDGVTVVPVASLRGAGGGGGGGTDTDGGSGGGFVLRARPAGAYVIKNGEVAWHPALDLNRIISLTGTVAIVTALSWRSVAKRRAKKR